MGLFVSNDNLNGYNSGYHTDLFSPSDYTIYDEGVDINYTTLGYEIVAESQQEWNTLMKQVALNELAVYSSNGCREVLYEATSFSAVFNKIKVFSFTNNPILYIPPFKIGFYINKYYPYLS